MTRPHARASEVQAANSVPPVLVWSEADFTGSLTALGCRKLQHLHQKLPPPPIFLCEWQLLPSDDGQSTTHSLAHSINQSSIERTSSEGGAAADSIAMSPSFHSIICLTKAQTAPSTAKTKEGETASYNQFIVSTFIDKRRSKLAIARGRRSACSIRAIGRAPSCFGKSFAGKLPLRVGNMRMKKCFFVELTRGCLPCIISFGKMKVVNL